MEFYPHRAEILARLQQIHAAGRMRQPVLLTGPEGSGKEATALEFARRLACVSPGECTPAKPCESCAKVVTFQHPDILWIG
ncbi:DNA polymerase III subunit delta', partial [bacterium]|nr:DNA polymerase III subunit delta' [bacterium]